MTQNAPPKIPAEILAMLNGRWPLEEYRAFPSVWNGYDDAPDEYRRRRRADPSFYFYDKTDVRSSADSIDMTPQEATAIVRADLLPGLSKDQGKNVAINEHAQHALADFCRDTYAAWALCLERLEMARRASRVVL